MIEPVRRFGDPGRPTPSFGAAIPPSRRVAGSPAEYRGRAEGVGAFVAACLAGYFP